jgi:hypothetical protein
MFGLCHYNVGICKSVSGKMAENEKLPEAGRRRSKRL